MTRGNLPDITLPNGSVSDGNNEAGQFNPRPPSVALGDNYTRRVRARVASPLGGRQPRNAYEIISYAKPARGSSRSPVPPYAEPRTPSGICSPTTLIQNSERPPVLDRGKELKSGQSQERKVPKLPEWTKTVPVLPSKPVIDRTPKRKSTSSPELGVKDRLASSRRQPVSASDRTPGKQSQSNTKPSRLKLSKKGRRLLEDMAQEPPPRIPSPDIFLRRHSPSTPDLQLKGPRETYAVLPQIPSRKEYVPPSMSTLPHLRQNDNVPNNTNEPLPSIQPTRPASGAEVKVKDSDVPVTPPKLCKNLDVPKSALEIEGQGVDIRVVTPTQPAPKLRSDVDANASFVVALPPRPQPIPKHIPRRVPTPPPRPDRKSPSIFINGKPEVRTDRKVQPVKSEEQKDTEGKHVVQKSSELKPDVPATEAKLPKRTYREEASFRKSHVPPKVKEDRYITRKWTEVRKADLKEWLGSEAVAGEPIYVSADSMKPSSTPSPLPTEIETKDAWPEEDDDGEEWPLPGWELKPRRTSKSIKPAKAFYFDLSEPYESDFTLTSPENLDDYDHLIPVTSPDTDYRKNRSSSPYPVTQFEPAFSHNHRRVFSRMANGEKHKIPNYRLMAPLRGNPYAGAYTCTDRNELYNDTTKPPKYGYHVRFPSLH